MFSKTFDLVIKSTDNKPIDFLQANSPNEIRVSFKSRVKVIIEHSSFNAAGTSNSVSSVHSGTEKDNECVETTSDSETCSPPTINGQVNCEDHQSTVASIILSNCEFPSDIRGRSPSKEITPEKALNGADVDSESDIELDSDTDTTATEPFTSSEDEVMTKKRPENAKRKPLFSSHDRQNSVDQSLHDDLLQGQTKVHVLRLPDTASNANGSACNLEQIYSEKSENLFKNNLEYVHRHVPRLEQDSLSSNDDESDDDPFPFNRPSKLPKIKNDLLPLNCSQASLHLDSGEDELEGTTHETAHVDVPCPDQKESDQNLLPSSVRQSVDNNPLQATYPQTLLNSNCEDYDQDLGRSDKLESQEKRNTKSYLGKKRKRVVIQSSSDSEDLDDGESDSDVQLQEDDDGLASRRKEKLKLNQGIAAMKRFGKNIKRRNFKRRRSNLNLPFYLFKSKINLKFGKIANSKKHNRCTTCQQPMNKEPSLSRTVDINNSDESNQLTTREIDNQQSEQTESLSLDTRPDAAIKEADKRSIEAFAGDKLVHSVQIEETPNIDLAESSRVIEKDINILIEDAPNDTEVYCGDLPIDLTVGKVSEKTKTTESNEGSVPQENEKGQTLASTLNNGKDNPKVSIERTSIDTEIACSNSQAEASRLSEQNINIKIEDALIETLMVCNNILSQSRSTDPEPMNTEPSLPSAVHFSNGLVEANPLAESETRNQTETPDSEAAINNGHERETLVLGEDELNQRVPVAETPIDIVMTCSGTIQTESGTSTTVPREPNLKEKLTPAERIIKTEESEEPTSHESKIDDEVSERMETVNTTTVELIDSIKDEPIEAVVASTDEIPVENGISGESIRVNDNLEISEIAKVLSSAELEEESIKAIHDEQARMERLKEQEKKFNQFRLKMDKNPERLVLDFDENGNVRVEVDSTLLEALKAHQREGVKFMYNSTIENVDRLKDGDKGTGCILAHCMGLGKTFQAIAFIHTLLSSPSTKDHIKTILIAVPVNVLKNWKREFNKWIKRRQLQNFKIFELTKRSSVAFRIDQLRLWHEKGGVLIIAHTLFSSLCHTRKNSPADIGLALEQLVDPGPDMIIIDEGHILKSSTNQLNKIVASMRTRRKILLTGTPLQNNLVEYYTMIDIIKPRLLGTSKGFANFFQTPIEKGQKADSTAEDFRVMKERESVLHQLVSGSIQRYNFDTLKPFLQPKFEFALFIRPTKMISEMYNYFLDQVCKEKRILVHSVYLRFCVNHPAIYQLRNTKGKRKEKILADADPIDDSSFDKDWYKEFLEMISTHGDLDLWNTDFISASYKFVMFFKILRKCIINGEKLVVASQSIETLDLIALLLVPFEERFGNWQNRLKWFYGKNYFRIDGSKSPLERFKQIQRFNNPKNKEARLFLLSTKAGGIGINLHGANRCIIFDVSWNPSDDIQAICRVFRLGQTKPVYVYRFVTKDTMEEQIFRKQIVKLGMAIRVVDQQQVERIFTTSELNEFYDTRPKAEYQITNISGPQPDPLLSELVSSENNEVLKCIELDSLLEKKPEEDLTENERQLAWKEYQTEREEAQDLKKGRKIFDESVISSCDQQPNVHDSYSDSSDEADEADEADAAYGDHVTHLAPNNHSEDSSLVSDSEPSGIDGELPLRATEVDDELEIPHRNSCKRKKSVTPTKEKKAKNREESNETSKLDKNNQLQTEDNKTNNEEASMQKQGQSSKSPTERILSEPLPVVEKNLQTNHGIILDVDSEQNVRVAIPEILVKQLKPHQIEGIKFMYKTTIGNVDKLKDCDKGSGCILRHCMGLGKSWQVITFIHTILSCSYTEDHIKTVLIVVPFNLLKIWEQEFDKCLKYLDALNINTIDESTIIKARLYRLDSWRKNGGVLIIDPDTLTRTLNLGNNIKQKVNTLSIRSIERHLINPGPDLIIIDDGHKLLESPQNNQHVRQMRTQRKILLTGISLKNHLKEYYKMTDTIRPQFLGSEEDFATKFVNPIVKGQKTNSNFVELELMKKKERELNQLLNDWTQKFGFETLKPLVPVKVEYTLIIRPTELIAKMYNHFLNRVSERNGHFKHSSHLLLLINHPAIYYSQSSVQFAQSTSPNEPRTIFKTSLKDDWFKQFVKPEDVKNSELSNKFIVMLNIIRECVSQKQKLVIASQSYDTLELIQNLLIDRKWIIGKNLFRIGALSSSIKIQKQTNKFNDSDYGETQICLLSSKAGISINLTGASRIIIFDVSWDSNDDIYAICRLYRMGQTKPVYVYRLVTKDTMEERIFLKQMDKRGTGIRAINQQQVEDLFTTSELNEFYETFLLSDYHCSLLNDPKDRLLAKAIRNTTLVLRWLEVDSTVEQNANTKSIEDKTQYALFKYQKLREVEMENRRKKLLMRRFITSVSQGHENATNSTPPTNANPSNDR